MINLMTDTAKDDVSVLVEKDNMINELNAY